LVLLITVCKFSPILEVGVTTEKIRDPGRINSSGSDGNTKEADGPCG
jgi:hypothetical protein